MNITNDIQDKKIVNCFTIMKYLRDTGSIDIQGLKSNSEIFRALKNRSIIINGETPEPDWNVLYPFWQLVIFHKGDRKTTLIDDYEYIR